MSPRKCNSNSCQPQLDKPKNGKKDSRVKNNHLCSRKLTRFTRFGRVPFRVMDLIHFALVLLLWQQLFVPIVPIVAAREFQWTANIERSSGIATSREVSIAPNPITGIQEVFSQYPYWLVKPSVTWGLLKVQSKRDGSTCIQIRGTNYDILNLGKTILRGTDTIIFPVTGGILARPDPSKTAKCSGRLAFSVHKNQVLETRIECGYRPSIAGPPPVSRIRAWTYRSTQSLFHAYVMWRFHHYCQNVASESILRK